MRLRRTKSLSVGLVVFLMACPCSSSGPYGKAAREIQLAGTLRDSVSGTASPVFVIQSQTEDDYFPRSLDVDLEDAVFGTPSPFSGHILHVRLLDSQGHVMQEIVTTKGQPYTKSILTETVLFGPSEN